MICVLPTRRVLLGFPEKEGGARGLVHDADTGGKSGIFDAPGHPLLCPSLTALVNASDEIRESRNRLPAAPSAAGNRRVPADPSTCRNK